MVLQELLLPTTDRLVYIEAVVVLLVWVVGSWSLRSQQEWRLVLTGVVFLILGAFALRAVH